MVSVYRAGTVGNATTCHNSAPCSDTVPFQNVGTPGVAVPVPDALPTTRPDASFTATATSNDEGPLPFVHTSTDGITTALATGVPSRLHPMGPVTLAGTYTPHGAMYGPGVVTTVSHTWR